MHFDGITYAVCDLLPIIPISYFSKKPIYLENDGHENKLKSMFKTFRVIKRQLGHAKMGYRGLKKNTAQLITLFTLSNI